MVTPSTLGLSGENDDIVSEIMQSHGFEDLKETQRKAFENGVLDDDNHLLVAETGNGKTLCAEAVSKKTVDAGGRVAYLVPSRQLVRDKKETIEEWMSREVEAGSPVYSNASVVVATFDSFYRGLLTNPNQLATYETVILDDFHEIYGSFRGPDIEKAIAAILSENLNVFAMSATLGNPEELGEWLNATVTVSYEGREIDIHEETITYENKSKKKAIADFASSTETADKAPFLIFNYAKSWAESRAKEIAERDTFEPRETTEYYEGQLESRVDGELTDKMRDLADCLSSGVAWHHASLPNQVKSYLEDLYYDREIDCLCATTTIAYGFDAPVQTVVVGDIRRGPTPVGVWEYIQWIGRAARPGYDYEEGYAYTVTNNPQQVEQNYFEPRTLEPVTTHFEDEMAFNTLVLELITSGWTTPEDLSEFLKKTLYWNSISEKSSWGEPVDKEQQMKQRLKQSISWLEGHGFISQKHTEPAFMSTTLGEATVEFLFETFSSYDIRSIRQFYLWLGETEDSEITPLNTLFNTAKIFDETMSGVEKAGGLEQETIKQNLPVTEASLTAVALDTYWTRNYSLEQFEQDLNLPDATVVPRTAKKLSNLIEATEVLFIANPKTMEPDWLQEYAYRLNKGIREDEYALVRSIDHLGRKRIRELRRYFENNSFSGMPDHDEGTPLTTYLTDLNESVERKDQFIAVVENIPGVGNSIANNIWDYIEETSPKTGTTTTSPPKTTNMNQADDTEADAGKNATLDDF